jgi:hypothetical protein
MKSLRVHGPGPCWLMASDLIGARHGSEAGTCRAAQAGKVL